MKKNDETLIIQITNKGAIIGSQMYCLFLQILTSIKTQTKATTINEIKNEALGQLKKMEGWLERDNDNTISEEEIRGAKKEIKETIKLITKNWK